MLENEQNSGHMTRDIILKHFTEYSQKEKKKKTYLDSLYFFTILAKVHTWKYPSHG